MFYVSEIYKTAPQNFETPLQEKVYQTLSALNIPFERVETDEAISMDACENIGKVLKNDVVKTLLLCNRQKTQFYLFITKGNKPFSSKAFSAALGISRVSFAPADLFCELLGASIGAATVFSALWDENMRIQIVFDKEVAKAAEFSCSDGTTTGFMKLKTEDVVHRFLPYTKHELTVLEV